MIEKNNNFQKLNVLSTEDPSKKMSHQPGWKIIVFTAVICLALTAAAYSLFFKDDYTQEEYFVAPIDNTVILDEKLTGFDLGFVVIYDINDELPEIIDDAVVEIAAAAKSEGVRTRVVRLHPDNADCVSMIDKYNVMSSPAVLVLGSFNMKILILDEITEEALMKAYYLVTREFRDESEE